LNASKNHGTHRLRIRLLLPLRERSSSFNNSKDREMCIINNRSRSSVNERKKNLRGEEKGEGEGERESW
jgi:hypothetical protein